MVFLLLQKGRFHIQNCFHSIDVDVVITVGTKQLIVLRSHVAPSGWIARTFDITIIVRTTKTAMRSAILQSFSIWMHLSYLYLCISLKDLEHSVIALYKFSQANHWFWTIEIQVLQIVSNNFPEKRHICISILQSNILRREALKENNF